MSGSIRIGLVGCGRLAELGYVPAFALTDRARLVAVVDPDRDRSASIARAAGADVRPHGDFASMLDAGDLDAVVLASPASVHVADATAAVAASLPVLVEKPPAPDAHGAAELAALGGSVWAGFNRRFDPGARIVRDAVPDDGPIAIDASIQYRRASWNPHTVHDDVLIDLAPHLVDWVRWIAHQDVVGVRARDVSPDRASLRLTTTRGTASITASADRFHAESVDVVDVTGSTIARHRAGGPVSAVTDRVLRRNQPHPLAASLAAQLDAFADVIGGQPNADLATAVDGVCTMAVIDAARVSAASGGRRVDVHEPREQISC